MKLSFNLGTADLLALYKLGLKKKSFLFKKYIFGIGVLIAICLSLFDKYIRNNSSSIQSPYFTGNFWFLSAYNLVLVTLCIFLVRIIVISFFRIQVRKKTKFMGDRELEVVNGKLKFSSKNSKTEYPLKIILKIEENRDYFFIYTNEISVIIVPKRTPESKLFINNLLQETNLKILIAE